jgi:enoyl-CoA hydratase
MPIHYRKEDHIVLITIDRYERRNAIDVEHAMQLIDCWIKFRDDSDAWVAIITGVKNAFCAGGDLNAMGQIAKELAETGHSNTQDGMNGYGKGSITLKGMEIYKPIIAAVNGYCMAGGMELLGGTDLRIASTEAVFSITEPRRGLFAGGGSTARLPRQLSWPAAMELLLVAGNTNAERAFQLGLVNEVVPPGKLLNAAYRWAREIAKNAPLAVQGTKKSALKGFAASSLEAAYKIEDECANEVFATEDAQEGAKAFLEKRQPVWKGR